MVACRYLLAQQGKRALTPCFGYHVRHSCAVGDCCMVRFLRPVLFVCGILTLLMAGLMLAVACFAWWRQDPEMEVFLISFGITLGCGLLLVMGCHDRGFHLVARQLYLLTSLSWVLMSLFGALPLFFSHFQLSAEDAVFEAVSGITTTGSTILSGIEHLAPSLLV